MERVRSQDSETMVQIIFQHHAESRRSLNQIKFIFVGGVLHTYSAEMVEN
jgi:hypothetical protein